MNLRLLLDTLLPLLRLQYARGTWQGSLPVSHHTGLWSKDWSCIRS